MDMAEESRVMCSDKLERERTNKTLSENEG